VLDQIFIPITIVWSLQHLSLERGKLGGDIILLCTGPIGPDHHSTASSNAGGGASGSMAGGGAKDKDGHHHREYHFSMFTNTRETFELMGQLTKMAIKEWVVGAQAD